MVKFSSPKGKNITLMNIHQINERIKATQLRVIDENINLGVLNKEEALKIARSKELDLVLIADQAVPPVAKIMNYKKFLYEEKKKKSASKARSKKSEIKELRLSPTIGFGDLSKRAERAKEFINNGNRVKISIQLQGREMAYPEIGFEKIKLFEQQINDTAKLESEPKLMGKNIIALFSAK